MPVVLDLTTGVNVFVLDWDSFVVAVAELLDLGNALVLEVGVLGFILDFCNILLVPELLDVVVDCVLESGVFMPVFDDDFVLLSNSTTSLSKKLVRAFHCSNNLLIHVPRESHLVLTCFNIFL